MNTTYTFLAETDHNGVKTVNFQRIKHKPAPLKEQEGLVELYYDEAGRECVRITPEGMNFSLPRER